MVVSTAPIEHATVEVTATSAVQSITLTAPSTQEVAIESSEVTAAASATVQGQLWKEGR